VTARRRVLHVHNGADTYGASRSLLRLQPHLAPRWERHVVLPERGPLVELLEATGAVVHVQPVAAVDRRGFSSWAGRVGLAAGVVSSARRLARLVRTLQVDVLHTNSALLAAAGLAARAAGVAHVWHVREWFQEFGALWAPYERYMRWTADAIVPVSEAVATQFRDRRRVHVVHNGFDLAEFRVDSQVASTGLRGRLGLGDAFVAGCVGRVKRVRKGQEVLVDALALLRTEGRDVRGLVVGTEHRDNVGEMDALRARVAQHELEDRVVLVGEMADPRPAYAAMDVLVLPSAQPEPFGGVVMEAMAMGVPVVATAIGGSVEQVDPGVTGLLVPPADARALADALRRLMDDAPLRARMGAASVARIEACFDLRDKAAALEVVFEAALRRRSAPRPAD
jgi:glycosyltransferase involved in cell wall biosynthesis